MDRIVTYIKKLKREYSSKWNKVPFDEYFSRGGCYQFYTLLQAKFPKGEMAVTHELKHVVFYYRGKYYDVDGRYNNVFAIMAKGKDIVPSAKKYCSGFSYSLAEDGPSGGEIKKVEEMSSSELMEFYLFLKKYKCNSTLSSHIFIFDFMSANREKVLGCEYIGDRPKFSFDYRKEESLEGFNMLLNYAH